MIVTVWNNGSYSNTGAGYGLKLSARDRDTYFNKEWKEAIVVLGENGKEVAVNIDKPSFWKGCRELIHKEIGKWLIGKGYGSWQKGNPPKLVLVHSDGIRFVLKES